MPDKFNMHLPPFDRLNEDEQVTLRNALDVAYFRANDTLLHSGQTSRWLFILIKGVVEEKDAASHDIFAHYTNEDMFDVRAVLQGTTRHQFIALEDTLAYLLPRDVFISLYQQNAQFAAYFDSNLSTRQALLDEAKQQQNLAEFILSKVDNSIFSTPVILAPETTIKAATEILKSNKIDSALIDYDLGDHTLVDDRRYGIITRTNMLHAMVLDGLTPEHQVGDIATRPVLEIEHGEYVFNAMVKMIRHKVKRLMVCDAQQAVGMLDMTQILSTFSTHSHVLTLSIARANSIEELIIAANKQRQLVDNLVTNGIRTRFIMELISTVNEQIIEKAFRLVVPPALHDHCCFIVLGSEGRGEQILKTDQDNALIIKDGLEFHRFESVLNTLTHTLVQLGYPLCPGKVMVTNSDWVKTQHEWKTTVSRWKSESRAEALMNLAILADAHAVAGNKTLLTPIKSFILENLKGQELLLADFAAPALNFSLPLTLFGNVKASKQGIDIKQGGIFPIVHGIRTLSLEFAIQETNTFERIEALIKQRVLEKSTGDNLSEALKQFFKLRLTQQLHDVSSSNTLDVKTMDRAQRDLLRHSLHIVKKFKQWLAYHYQIRQ